MSEFLELHQVQFSNVTYDNGILSLEKRTGGYIKHKNVPQSIFNGFQTTGNADSYYYNKVQNHFPYA